MDARMRTLLFVVTALFAVFAAGCDMTNSPGVFTLSTTTTPGEGGTITPADGEFEADSEVQLEAEPAEGYRFTGWDGDLSGSDNPATLTFDSDKQVSAVFEVKEYALDIDTRGEGRVKEEIIEQAGKGDYEHGTTVQLTAEPAEGWRFAGWEGDLEGDENPVTLEIEDEQQITAVFERREYALNITIEGGGAVAEEVVREKAKDYKHGTVVKLTAKPENGWKFTRWEGDLEGSENPEVIAIEEEKNVTAVFERQVHTLSTETEGEGTISEVAEEEKGKSRAPESGSNLEPTGNDLRKNQPGPSHDRGNSEPAGDSKTKSAGQAGQSEYEHGTTVQLTAEADEGWTFARWEGDLEGEENPATVEMTEDKNVTAVFEAVEGDGDNDDGSGDSGDDGDNSDDSDGEDDEEEDDEEESEEFTVDLSVDGEGTVARDPDREQYESGEEVELTAKPENGWQFAGWKGDLESGENPETITVDEDKQITAVFEEVPETFTITTSVEGEGSVAVDPDKESYEDGEEVTVTAGPAEGWSFSRWGEGDFSGTENPVTFHIDQNKEITAIFEVNKFTLDVTVEGDGEILLNPEKEQYEYGEQVTLTAEPAADWQFDHWEGALGGEENPETLVIEEDTSVKAVFETATVSHGYVEGVTPSDDPRYAERTYPVVQADWEGPGGDKKWLGWNLGATKAPESAIDTSKAAAGWYFQFNRKQGHFFHNEQSTTPSGSSLIPTVIRDWEENDPCRHLLGEDWRLPTREEWENFRTAPAGQSGMDRGNLTAAFESDLNLHASGNLDFSPQGPVVFFSLNGTDQAFYHSSSIVGSDGAEVGNSFILHVTSDGSSTDEVFSESTPGLPKNLGASVRCIED